MTVVKDITDKDIASDNLQDEPFLRMNRTASLTLSTSFQRIDFNGTSTLNNNTYPIVEGQTYRRVDWDLTNKLFKFNRTSTGIYNTNLGFQFNGGLRPADIDIRFVIPVPTTPIYFPFPDTMGYITIAQIERLTDYATEYARTIRSTSPVQQYGLGIEIRTSAALVSYPQLTHAVIEIYPF